MLCFSPIDDGVIAWIEKRPYEPAMVCSLSLTPSFAVAP